MKTLLNVVGILFGGIGLGLIMSFIFIKSDFGFNELRLGPWKGWPQSGLAETDPFMKAKIARNGSVPLAPSEGLALSADRDSEGQLLNGKCRYLFSGTVPTARYWTLNVTDAYHAPFDLPLKRSAFTSSEITRQEGGSFGIILSAEPQAGNWLPIPADKFHLVLTLYEMSGYTFLDSTSIEALPAIQKIACS